MGIGVHYYSGGKRRAFSLDGVPDAGSEIDAILRGGAEPAHRAPVRAKHPSGKVRVSSGDVPEFIEDKLSGSLAQSLNGKICLEGEEQETQVDGRKVYCSRDGRRGWGDLNDIDMPESGVLIGPEAGYSDVEADTGTHKLNGAGFAITMIARVAMAQIEVAGSPKDAVYAFARTLRFTPNGRLFEISPEKRQLLGLFRSGGAPAGWTCTPEFNTEDELTGLTFENADVSKHVAVEECEWGEE